MTFNLEKYTKWQAMLRKKRLPTMTRNINGKWYKFWVYIAERGEGREMANIENARAKHAYYKGKKYHVIYQPLKFGGWLWRRKL